MPEAKAWKEPAKTVIPQQSSIQDMKWELKAKDSAIIYGALTEPKFYKPSKVVVIAPGLGCSINEYAYKRASQLLAEQGYAVLRFAFYDGQTDGRCLTDCTIPTFVSDLNDVLAWAQQTYKRVYLIGHSYGGLTMAHANPKVDAMSMWDPSYANPDWMTDKTRSAYRELAGYIVASWGVELVLGSDFQNEFLKQTTGIAKALGKDIQSPLQVIHAGVGSGTLYERGESYHTYAKVDTDHVLIEDGDHMFCKDSSLELAVEATEKWFSKYV